MRRVEGNGTKPVESRLTRTSWYPKRARQSGKGRSETWGTSTRQGQYNLPPQPHALKALFFLCFSSFSHDHAHSATQRERARSISTASGSRTLNLLSNTCKVAQAAGELESLLRSGVMIVGNTHQERSHGSAANIVRYLPKV